eukprot:TRINITY_DN4626_c0_g1_i2.p1 TRINITY_DN4626_c0_g1~~TRINITY_DN4626_c0_g1_i2.p1  ORF type:complete len:308 (-),score=61.15 TRINITY_DN4626_c0_g1_i2:115-1038(-)
MKLYEKCHKLLYGHTGWIYSVAISEKGVPFSGSNDHTIRSFDLEYNQCENIYMGHESKIISIKMDDPKERFISASDDGTLKFWDSKQGCKNNCLYSKKAHTSSINAMQLRSHDRIIVTVGEDLSINVWRIIDDNQTPEIKLLTTAKSVGGAPNCVAIKGNSVIYGSRSGFVGCVSFDENWTLLDNVQFSGDIFEDTLCCDFKEEKIYSGHSNGTLCVWEKDSNGSFVLIKKISLHEKEITCMQVYEETLFTASFDGNIKQLALNDLDLNVLRVFERMAMMVYCLCVRNNFLYVGCDEEVLRAWNLDL